MVSDDDGAYVLFTDYKALLELPKLTEIEQALLDLTDGSFYYWQEIQQHTGFDEELRFGKVFHALATFSCKEILAVINKIKVKADS